MNLYFVPLEDWYDRVGLVVYPKLNKYTQRVLLIALVPTNDAQARSPDFALVSDFLPGTPPHIVPFLYHAESLRNVSYSSRVDISACYSY